MFSFFFFFSSRRRHTRWPRDWSSDVCSSDLPFGTSLPAVQQIPSRLRPWEREIGGGEIVAAAQAAEHAGFAWVSCSDHPLVPVSRAAAMGTTWYDAGST